MRHTCEGQDGEGSRVRGRVVMGMRVRGMEWGRVVKRAGVNDRRLRGRRMTGKVEVQKIEGQG